MPTQAPGAEVAVKDQAELSGVTASTAVTPGPDVSADQQVQSNLGANLAANLPPTIAGPVGTSFLSGFVEGYLTPKDIRERCEKLQKEFPHLVELVETGISTHGYDGKNEAVRGSSDLFYLRIGPQTADRDNKTGIFQFAAPHARERMNPMSMMELTEQLVRNYDPSSTDEKVKKNTEVMDALDIFIAIDTNPDGHNYAAFDDPMWRKNRAPVPNGDVGVDINRNNPFGWEASDKTSGQTYSGKGPASEAETQALLHVVEKHPNILFLVDWHSHGEEIRRPLNLSEGDDKLYDEMHGRVQKAMTAVAGNEYDVVVSQVTKGTSDDHYYQVDGIISTVMETGTEFTPEESEALIVMEESVAGAHEFLEYAKDFEQGNLS